MTTFTETAMADRFKAATEPTESTPQLRAIKHLIEQLDQYKPTDIVAIDAKSSISVMLTYIERWVSKEYDSAELVQMLGIRIENLAIDMAKKEAQL
jgi:hypothetical protein